jgi:hypothetical protein
MRSSRCRAPINRLRFRLTISSCLRGRRTWSAVTTTTSPVSSAHIPIRRRERRAPGDPLRVVDGHNMLLRGRTARAAGWFGQGGRHRRAFSKPLGTCSRACEHGRTWRGWTCSSRDGSATVSWKSCARRGREQQPRDRQAPDQRLRADATRVHRPRGGCISGQAQRALMEAARSPNRSVAPGSRARAAGRRAGFRTARRAVRGPGTW